MASFVQKVRKEYSSANSEPIATAGAGNLLIGFAYHRSDSQGTPTGSFFNSTDGVTTRLFEEVQIGDSTYRHAIAVFTKIADGDETSFQVPAWDGASTCYEIWEIADAGDFVEAYWSPSTASTKDEKTVSMSSAGSLAADSIRIGAAFIKKDAAEPDTLSQFDWDNLTTNEWFEDDTLSHGVHQMSAWLEDSSAGSKTDVATWEASVDGSRALTGAVVVFGPVSGGTNTSLTVVDTAQSQASDAAGLTQLHKLAGVDSAQAQASDNAAITQSHKLTALDTAQSQASDVAALTQSSTLAGVDTAQTQASDAANLTQSHKLTALDTAQSQASDVAALTQVHKLAGVDTAQSQTSDNATISTAGTVSPLDTVQTQASDAASLTQVHKLAGVDTSQTQASDNATLSTAGVIAPLDTAQSQASDGATIIQHHKLTGVDTAQTQFSDDAVVTLLAPGQVSPLDTTQTQFSNLVQLTQVHKLAGLDTTQMQVSDVAALTFTPEAGLATFWKGSISISAYRSEIAPFLLEYNATTFSTELSQ